MPLMLALACLTTLGWMPPPVDDLLTPEQASLIRIAHRSIESEVQNQAYSPASGTPPKAVFVTVERNGTIRGCRGDLLPRTASLEQEVSIAAADAAAHDPRYRPIAKNELKQILVTITLVDREESLQDISQLTPDEGLVLTSNHRTGIVLPYEGKDPQTRLKWAYKKAGVPEGSSSNLNILIAQRFRG